MLSAVQNEMQRLIASLRTRARNYPRLALARKALLGLSVITVVLSFVLISSLTDPEAKASSGITVAFIVFCLSFSGCLVLLDRIQTADPPTE